jgi:hypothetical protein
MIIVELNGGLGNQMFQYALGKSIAKSRNLKLLISIKKLNEIDESIYLKRSFELDVFDVNWNFTQTIHHRLFFPNNSLIFKCLNKILRCLIIEEKKFSYTEINTKTRNTYLIGYFQSEKYFQHISNELRNEFLFKKKKNQKTEHFQKEIMKANSISVHIRRGDYVEGITSDLHGFAGLEYYMESINYIKSNIANPKFYFFSDDCDWVSKNLLPAIDCAEIVNHNKNEESWQDMYLMSLCKHNIIANSSFSWWGAWLNSNVNKMVIAPKKWFANKEMNLQTKDLIPENWLKL